MKGREAFEESIISIMGDQRVFHSIATIAEKDVWCLHEKLLTSRLYRTQHFYTDGADEQKLEAVPVVCLVNHGGHATFDIETLNYANGRFFEAITNGQNFLFLSSYSHLQS